MWATIDANESKLGQMYIDLPENEFIEFYGESTFEYFTEVQNLIIKEEEQYNGRSNRV